MYLGRIVETASAADLFKAPRHPYSRALLSAIPVAQPNALRERHLLPGDPPSPINPPSGCHLHPRCPHVRDICRTAQPALELDAANHATACHVWREIAASGTVRVDADAPSPELMRLFARFGTPAV
jgi:oligopeptide/dipeptide ABC transporter ATP-binding protein